jgi:hypothetical protein
MAAADDTPAHSVTSAGDYLMCSRGEVVHIMLRWQVCCYEQSFLPSTTNQDKYG